MNTEDHKPLESLLAQVLQQQATPDAWLWLQEKGAQIATAGNATALNTAFSAAPRKTGTQSITLTQKEKERFLATQPQLHIDNWSLDRLARVWLLMQVDASNKDVYFSQIEALFLTAAVNEQVALYSALPALHYPEMWHHRCTEGIRSNVGTALEAIMCNNVYPSQYLTQAEWNQLVLKAFFTDKPVHQIIGLDSRANKELAYILSDYAHERWAAGRKVHPQLWRCVAPFVDETLFKDIVRLSQSKNETDLEAAALVCRHSHYTPCKELLQQKELQSLAANQNLTWQSLAENARAAV